MFRHNVLSDTELKRVIAAKHILWILQIRNPCSWSDGMYRKPWHMCSPDRDARCDGIYIGINSEETSNMTRAQFMRSPWRDNVEANNNATNFEYANVFALRRHKLKIMLQIKEAIPRRATFSRLHVLEKNPFRFLQELRAVFNIEINERAVSRSSSSKRHLPVCLDEEEYDIVRRTIDWTVEGQVGYSIDDCKICIGTKHKTV